MRDSSDLLSRWPALGVDIKRDHLRRSLYLSPRPIQSRVAADSARAQSAADAMWRRDPAAWSAAADVQATITNRLGWLDSPALMADSLDRIKALVTKGMLTKSAVDFTVSGLKPSASKSLR